MSKQIEVFRLSRGEFGANGPTGHRVSDEETIRLARMFEAAPEMYEVLQSLLSGRHARFCTRLSRADRSCSPGCVEVRAALAKADGKVAP